MNTKPLTNLSVIGIRYLDGNYISGEGVPLDAYENAKTYQVADVPLKIIEPRFEETEQDEVEKIGLINNRIAEEVAKARLAGDGVIMVGGNCCHSTGMLGGLQTAHGPDTRIGLVWFDAHGDFNTTKTTISGMLGGMPVAVAAGLTLPSWRERSQMVVPIPTERILMVDVRNLDPDEEALIRATDAVIAASAPGFPGYDLKESLEKLSQRVDLIYLHIDSDILDESYTPNHKTKEPNGPSMEQVKNAIGLVLSTGKVAAYAVVSVYGEGEGADISIESGMELIKAGLKSWREYGMA